MRQCSGVWYKGYSCQPHGNAEWSWAYVQSYFLEKGRLSQDHKAAELWKQDWSVNSKTKAPVNSWPFFRLSLSSCSTGHFSALQPLQAPKYFTFREAQPSAWGGQADVNLNSCSRQMVSFLCLNSFICRMGMKPFVPTSLIVGTLNELVPGSSKPSTSGNHCSSPPPHFLAIIMEFVYIYLTLLKCFLVHYFNNPHNTW